MAHEGGRQFPVTQWSLIAKGRDGISVLFTRYTPALLAHLILRKRCRPEEAEDILQGFIASQILEKDLIGGADRLKGKFRTYLLTALDRYVSNVRRAARSNKRSTGSSDRNIDDAMQLAAAEENASAFEVEWARQILRRAVQTMEQECRGSSNVNVWLIFEARLLKPMLGDAPVPPYDELVKHHGLASPTQASNLLITGKRMFMRIMRNIIAEYTESDEQIDADIAELIDVLGNTTE